ncbi:MAG: fused response regulator/phosphatase [Rickettsiales bacterium]|nr:fused response regulator/phosphatase [Pseudomonadota bacterium]MDA0966318.1 fused response regulator/phosphatase [Pseudomonadota bacterium]MDG4543950.1 fused response regulator/phosphatase [Rickettsiales bacterium]MDG4545444.1 fused response regulator/phosphatase [Rickettsiales bacterium]MDG4547893.1 fused response regulator/phosphatase [Rickettsiales bacterium]
MQGTIKPNIIDKVKILIVDDDKFQRMVLRQIMTDCKFSNIEEAVDGEEGLNKILTWKPDLVFLDINMPKMNGLEVSQKIKASDLHNDVIIIMQTAVDKAEFKAEAFDAGITDFITKPLNEREVVSRVRAHLERKIFKDEVDRDYKRIQEELHEASILQKVLLPQEEVLNDIRQTQKLDIAQYYQSSSELGGDYISVHKLSDTRTAILIADVSGHGITASLYAFVLHTVIESQIKNYLAPGKILEEVNKRLCPLLVSGKFATLFLGIIDTERSVLQYAAAAAPTPLLFSGDKIIKIETKGYLLGTQKDATYETNQLPFNRDNILCLYSDAMTESPDKNGNVLSEDDLAKQIAGNLSKNAEDILKHTLSEFFMNHGQVVSDDLSFLVCKHL